MQIRITSVKQPLLLQPTITVLLDGIEVAWIGAGQSEIVDAAPGEHELLFLANTRRASVKFAAEQNVNASIKWNRATGGMQVLCNGPDVKMIK